MVLLRITQFWKVSATSPKIKEGMADISHGWSLRIMEMPPVVLWWAHKFVEQVVNNFSVPFWSIHTFWLREGLLSDATHW